MRQCKKIPIAIRATDEDTGHADRMLDTQGYKHALRVCNIYCFTQQQWIHERASTVRYTTNIACLVKRSLLTLHMDILFQRNISFKLVAL